GISLPGTGETPRCPVYIDGQKFATLEGTYDELSVAFQKLVDDYVSTKYAKREPVARAENKNLRTSRVDRSALFWQDAGVDDLSKYDRPIGKLFPRLSKPADWEQYRLSDE